MAPFSLLYLCGLMPGRSNLSRILEWLKLPHPVKELRERTGAGMMDCKKR